MLPKYFFSGDWGTTKFRLRLVETDTLKICQEQKSDLGIKLLYENYLNQNRLNQTQFFKAYLWNQIQEFPSEHHHHIIVLSGMASANIGLKELEYINFPFGGDGNDLLWESMKLYDSSTILLVSGVKTENAMMRGEEIQAVGLEDDLKPFGRGILILPGTHSKHLGYEKGSFIALKNFMTGELFEVLSQKSILANSVEFNIWSEKSIKTFEEGLLIGMQGNLLENLLFIRAKHLLKSSNKEENFYLLSGMLLGAELGYLRNETQQVFLAASESVFEMYQTALKHILQPEQLISFEGQKLKQALLQGQKKILSSYVK